jgi:hypothetical protein
VSPLDPLDKQHWCPWHDEYVPLESIRVIDSTYGRYMAVAPCPKCPNPGIESHDWNPEEFCWCEK